MSNSRVDTVSHELLSEMKRAGCHLLKFGVESASQKTLDSLKKGTKVEKIKNTFLVCKELGIESVGHFMIGSPGETKKDIMRTIKFAIGLDPTYASFDVLIEYPGSEISNAEKCELSREELESLHNMAFRKFYLRPSKVMQQILTIRNHSQLKNKVISTIQLWLGLLKARY
jgi:radical SAM superfamily enzyme YgiQ (UPF0313 family)